VEVRIREGEREKTGDEEAAEGGGQSKREGEKRKGREEKSRFHGHF